MFTRIYTLLRILSIDVVCGAILTAYLASIFLHVSPSIVSYVTLGLCVWLIYTLDHLMDAKEIDNKALSERHLFHQKHFKTLLRFWGGLLFFTTFLVVSYLSLYTIQLGIIAASLVVCHLVLVKLFGNKISILVQKEFGVALNFALGVMIPALGQCGIFSIYVPLLFVEILLLAYINLIEFSWFEHDLDQQQGQSSLARTLGKRTTGNIIYIVICAFLTLWVSSFFISTLNYAQVKVQANLLVMALVFLSLRKLPNYFGKNERFRVWGDIIFSSPVILMFV